MYDRRGPMKRTTIFADDGLLNELKSLSAEENRSVADIVREAMEEYVKRKRKAVRKFSFVGIGDSGRRHVAEEHERLLWKK
jgi:metal-responsive CopG/Arc/MetJ family transcriptional regulator